MRIKRGQIWVETVIYTLIGLVLIGIVLALVTPKINELKDRAIIDQTIDALKVFDSKISEVVGEGSGNVRNIEFGIKKGSLTINSEENQISYKLEGSKVLYSEPGAETSIGRIKVLTEELAKDNIVTLTIDFDFDLKLSGLEDSKTFTSAAVPYRFSVNHEGFTGEPGDLKEIINIAEIG